MAVNRSKEAANSPEWIKWDRSGAIGNISSAILRERRASTVPAQTAEGPWTGNHLASTVVGDPSRTNVWVSTVELRQPLNYRTPPVFETMIFPFPRSHNGLDTIEDSTGLLRPYIENRSTSKPAALRQHARAVDAVAVVYGTPKA